MATTPAIKSLQLASGSPTAYASVSQNIAGQIPKNVPDLNTSKLFGDAVVGLLKQYQGIEKYPFAAQEFGAREEQAKRLSFTDPSLIGAAPNVQASARGAQVAAVQPTVSGAQQAGQTFASRLQTLGDVINSVSALQQQEEQRAQQAKLDAQKLINDSFAQFGPDAFLQLPTDEQRRVEKMAGFPAGYIGNVAQAFRDREKAQQAREEELIRLQKSSSGQPSNKQAITDDFGKVIGFFNPDTGESTYYESPQGNEFEQFLAQEEQKAGQTFSPQKREQLRQQFGGQQGTTTLPKALVTPVQTIANSFDNEQIVKNYNTAQEGYQTLQSIGVNTSSPADDIAFIYAFAKIMDPNSVVREGEYNTIQKYAQTWADNFGFSAKRIFANTNFLSSKAKQKMLNALTPKVNTIQGQYDNIYREYGRRIDNLTGMNNGTDFLTQYSFTENQTTQQGRPPLQSFISQ